MRIPKIYGEYTQTDINRIDRRMRELQKSGKIKSAREPIFNSSVGIETQGLWCQEYWDIVVQHLSVDDIIFVLSHVQETNWNHFLYRACENKWEEICSELDREIFNAE